MNIWLMFHLLIDIDSFLFVIYYYLTFFNFFIFIFKHFRASIISSFSKIYYLMLFIFIMIHF